MIGGVKNIYVSEKGIVAPTLLHLKKLKSGQKDSGWVRAKTSVGSEQKTTAVYTTSTQRLNIQRDKEKEETGHDCSVSVVT